MKSARRVACASLFLSSAAFADSPVGWVLEADLEFGGDPVATVYFSDGTSQDVKAGQGVSIAVGGHFRASDKSPWDTRATIGYKYVTTKATNADITLTRVPLELIVDYMFENGGWLGLGVSHHTNISFDSDGLGPEGDFDDATGPVIEAGWNWIAATYTIMDYSAGGESASANNFGIKVIGRF
jgi:hypothetical protein